MRIASLVPSATEMLFALGLGEDVVAVTHECDHPPAARGLPQLTRTVISDVLAAGEIDAAVKAIVGEGRALYALDQALLEELEPDLIVTQSLCEVCAVSYEEVVEVAARLPSRPQVAQQDPRTLGEMLEDVIRLGEATKAEEAAHELRGELEGTSDVENYPGFASAIEGPWLMEQMRAQAQHVGARIEDEHVVALDLAPRPFRIHCDSGRSLTAEAVILATGAKAKWLGLPSEEMLKGFGVSACATCDGFFFRGKKVIVVGGGNSAVEEALYLSKIAAEVTVVHRRDTFRAERILIERLAARPNVAYKWNCEVDEILAGGAPVGSPARGCAMSRAALSRRSMRTGYSSPLAMLRRRNSCAASSN